MKPKTGSSTFKKKATESRRKPVRIEVLLNFSDIILKRLAFLREKLIMETIVRLKIQLPRISPKSILLSLTIFTALIPVKSSGRDVTAEIKVTPISPSAIPRREERRSP